MPALFGADDIPAWRPQWLADRIRYGQEIRRRCGCFADPVVFGHEDGCKLLAGAA